MKLSALLITGALLATVNAGIACDEHGLSGIVEHNELWIPAGLGRDENMTEEEFEKITSDVASIYSPIIEEKGKELQVINDWESGTVNAYAQQTGNIWKVSMFGGLARHETITKDAFALVVCHELGHHLGGAPKKQSYWFSSWASNEGQSDYWGTMKCFRKYAALIDNVKHMEGQTVDPTAEAQCKENFATEEEVAICLRGSNAGLSLGNLFRALRKLKTPLKFDTPDAKVVTKTNDAHPAPQCRLDTYFAGAVCDRGADEDVSDTDATVGMCNRSADDSLGLRPLCWFKPVSGEEA